MSCNIFYLLHNKTPNTYGLFAVITYKIQTYIKYEPTYYSIINKTPSQEEIELLEEQNNLLKQQISQLETILDSINNEVI